MLGTGVAKAVESRVAARERVEKAVICMVLVVAVWAKINGG